MSLIEKINQDFKEALRAKDEIKVSTLRLFKAAIKNEEIRAKSDAKKAPSLAKASGDKKLRKGENENARGDSGLDEAKVVEMVMREVKKRREAIEAYKKGGREELAEKEERESKILQKYLPEQLSRDKIKEIASEVIKETGAGGMSDFGKVMGMVMARVKGRAEGNVVSGVVKETLS